MRPFLRSAAAICSVFLMTSPLHAADLADILQQAKAKYSAAYKNVQDITIVQDIAVTAKDKNTAGQMDAELKIMKKGDKFRMETTPKGVEGQEGAPAMGELKIVTVSNGRETWTTVPLRGKVRISEDDARKFRTNQTDWTALVSPTAALAGSETVNGIDCYVIDDSAAKNPVFTKAWVDKKTFNVVKAQAKGDKKNDTVTMLFSDYRPLRTGGEMPYRIETFVNNEKTAVMTTKSLAVNTGLPDTLFDPASLDSGKKKGGSPFSMKDLMKGALEQAQ